MGRIALAGKQRHGLVKRQPDDGRIRADQIDDKSAGQPLDRIAARLAAPFSGSEIGLDFGLREPLEPDPAFHQTAAHGPLRGRQGNAGKDTVRAARQKAQALQRLVRHFAFRQNAPPDGDHSIGRQNIGIGEFGILVQTLRGSARFFHAQPCCKTARQFVALGSFIQIGGEQRIGLNADLLQQRETSWRRRRQHEFRTPACLPTVLAFVGHARLA